jgi:hypothetical protein
VAAKERKSQLHWYIPFFLLIALACNALAGDIDPSDYRPFSGSKFFLLAESNFSSDENAVVRLEAKSGNVMVYSGVDMVVYRVPQPVDFLKKQKNLHRIRVEGIPKEEGLANALGYIWDSEYKESRLVAQRVFSYTARSNVVSEAPELSQTPPYSYSTEFDNPPQFKRMPQFEFVEGFRYPLAEAEPIEPPSVKLEGSSHNFIEPRQGNVKIPLGTLKPGLYLVEAYVGGYRATTLVFVTDNVSITKISGEQILVWTANRKTGEPSAGAQVLLTDGVGTLQSGTTGPDGVFIMKKKSPERSYVIVKDDQGGVFASENYYYDTEIYATKLYAFTDRPLYQPGDTVHIKMFGRYFQDSQRSVPLNKGDVKVAVLDPTGNPVTTVTCSITGREGGDTSFQLPDQAIPGGYTLQMGYAEAFYTGSFRVARYSKPHFDIDIAFDKKEFKTGEPITGTVRLAYPGGRPVAGAQVDISVRAQSLTMVEHEVRYEGLFAAKLIQVRLASGPDGSAAFQLPPAKVPSRYVVGAIASDGPTYRVRASKELLIQAGAGVYSLKTPKRLTQPGERVEFTIQLLGGSDGAPAAWEAVRLEDQSVFSDSVSGDRISVLFPQSGSYTVRLKDAKGEIIGSTEHWVEGPQIKSRPGSISIVLNKEEYSYGEKALALISFPEEVENALVTLERDRVESYALLKTGSSAVQLKRENSLQWSAVIPITEMHRPNITLSVLYVRDGSYVFQNKGIIVTVPRVQISFKPNKETYLPGETVTVDVETRLEGKPVSAQLAVGVVDEMVYVLQPEIAPDIAEFFHHIRHNQVKTTSSLNFHTYDVATSSESQGQTSSSERPLKMLDRPRRENIDTAAWFPNLETGADGRTRFTFIMPQSLSRWRMTGRAMTRGGSVGQKTAYVISSKDCFLKWSGPAVFRQEDEPRIQVLGFNNGAEPISAEFVVEGIDPQVREAVSLKPGVNYLQFAFKAERDALIRTSLIVQGRAVDTLETAVAAVPRSWATTRLVHLDLDRPISTVPVPEGASDIRLSLAGNAAERFLSVADGLLDYPFGCVEQTASRLIPLSLAYEQIRALGLSQNVIARLHSQIAANRLRLVQMAGPDATFGWWGDLTHGSLFLTAYAYYADWNALRVMGLEAPLNHWEKLLDIYKKQGDREDLLHKAIILWLAKEMGLPTRTLWEGAADQAVKSEAEPGREEAPSPPGAANLMEPSPTSDFRDMALVLLDLTAEPSAPKAELHVLAVKSLERLAGSKYPLAKALLLMATPPSQAGRGDQARAAEILGSLSPESATIDRAVALLFLRKALSAKGGINAVDLFVPGDAWKKRPSRLDAPVWHWQGRSGENVTIELKAPPAKPVQANLAYETTTEEESRLPVKIERRLYRLLSEPINKDHPPTDEDGIPLQAQYKAVQVENPVRVDAGELYLDVIAISPPENTVYRYGVVDVALPPGADTEPMPWGVAITGIEGSPESRSYPGFQSYAVPVDELNGPMVFQQAVRFSQRGSFNMPPARFFRMYQPEEKAFESGAYVGRIEVH